MVLLWLLSCRPSAPVERWRVELGPPQPLEPAEAVMAADLDGDGLDEILRVRSGTAHWRDRSAELGGVAQVWARADLDGDGREEALVAVGAGRAMPEAAARLWSIGLDEARLLWEHRGPRNQVTQIHVRPRTDGPGQRVFLAHFRDGKVVEGGWLEDGQLRVVHEGAMATSMMPVEGGLLVGRLYGDEPKSDGDLRLLGEPPRATPSLRGVRTLAASDLDGDGREEWLVADGWHFAYGQQAQASLRLFPGDGSAPRVIASLDGNYTIHAIERMTGHPALLLSGSSAAVLLVADPLGWQPVELGRIGETDNAALHRGPEGWSVLLSGTQARRIPFALLPVEPGRASAPRAR